MKNKVLTATVAVAAAVFLVAGCYGGTGTVQDSVHVTVYNDVERDVTCWTVDRSGIYCIPNSDLDTDK